MGLKELAKFGVVDVSSAEGFVENQLEHDAKEDPRKGLVLEAFQQAANGFKRSRKRVDELETKLEAARAEAEKAKAKAEKAEGKAASEDWKQMVSLEFSEDRTICLVYVHPEFGGESFGVGAAYLNGAMQVELESPPFKVAMTLPYLRAVQRLLEEQAHTLPVGRSPRL